MQGGQLSGWLVTAIAEKITEPTFATTSSKIMRHNLKCLGFTKVGDEWQGQKGMFSP